MSEYSYPYMRHPHSHHAYAHSCHCCTPQMSCCHSAHASVCSHQATVPPSTSSFAELQSFCNSLRSGRNSAASTLLDHGDLYSPPASSCCQQHPTTESYHGEAGKFGNEPEEEDIGEEWFDEEAMGFERPEYKFDFPVPCEPALSCDQLNIMTLGDKQFFVDNDGYVQVHTYGECYKPFVEASIGIWFGPSHPCNKSELVHRGRRTAEAAHFVAIIEAIRTAGACGITKLQINTEYENAVKFMIYFIFKWEHNGWMTIKGTPVKNQVLIRELDYYSRFLDIKWNVITDDETEGLVEAYNLANEALSRSSGVASATSSARAVDELANGLQRAFSSEPAAGFTFGRTEASKLIKTFIPNGIDEAERQAARKLRFAPY